MTAIIPMVDFESMRVRALAEQGRGGLTNLCRLSTLVMPVCCSDGTIAVKLHPRGSPCEGKRAFFIREVCLEKESVAFLLGHPLDVGSLLLSAAIRTVNERGFPRTEIRQSSDKCLQLKLVGETVKSLTNFSLI